MAVADHYPDGLTEAVVDELLAEVRASVVPIHRPTSPFAVYELDMRKERREANRALDRVRALLVDNAAVAGLMGPGKSVPFLAAGSVELWGEAA